MPGLFQISAKGIIRNRHGVLLLKATLPDGRTRFDFPGGRLESGEQVFPALLRELTGELPGITDIRVKELMHTVVSLHLTDQQELLTLFYLIDCALPTITLSSEHTDYAWLGDSDIASFEQVNHAELIDEGHREAAQKALRLQPA